MSTGEHLRFSPVSLLSDTWRLGVGERGQSPRSRQLAVRLRRASDTGACIRPDSAEVGLLRAEGHWWRAA